jgi:1-acyl-sn-glycerol-3-phosphate acyltransferase
MGFALAAFRSALFFLFLVVTIVPWATAAVIYSIFVHGERLYWVCAGWLRLAVWGARVICGVRARVLGYENLPDSPVVMLPKHQSAWETLAFQQIFPPQVHVLKRELLWLPFFGWGLALMSPIPIDRGRGLSALRQIARRGKRRLEQGFWVVVFPEGTRVAPGRRRKYQMGGAWLAAHAGATVVPVAHNAGRCWPRNSFLKYPGRVTVRIGPPIESAGRDPGTINAEVEQWIETQQQTLDS